MTESRTNGSCNKLMQNWWERNLVSYTHVSWPRESNKTWVQEFHNPQRSSQVPYTVKMLKNKRYPGPVSSKHGLAIGHLQRQCFYPWEQRSLILVFSQFPKSSEIKINFKWLWQNRTFRSEEIWVPNWTHKALELMQATGTCWKGHADAGSNPSSFTV